MIARPDSASVTYRTDAESEFVHGVVAIWRSPTIPRSAHSITARPRSLVAEALRQTPGQVARFCLSLARSVLPEDL